MLAGRYPELVHLEKGTLDHPTVHEVYKIYEEHYDGWKSQYSMHLYQHKLRRMPKNEEELKGFDCGLGEAMRYILYGDTRLLSKRTFKGFRFDKKSRQTSKNSEEE